MSKRANPTVIGIFVVGAAILTIAAIIIFGSGFFVERTLMVAFFEGSVKGLDVGAPVMFRGVKIGEVSDITIHFDSKAMKFRIPVLIQTKPGRVEGMLEIDHKMSNKEFDELLIQKGLRAQLDTLSLVTGKLFVQLDFFPDSPKQLYGPASVGLDPEIPEIPTIISALQRLGKTIQNVPLDKIMEDLRATLQSVRELAASPEIPKSLRYLRQTLKDFRNLARNLDDKVDLLSASMDETLKEIRLLSQNVNGQVEPLASSVIKTSDQAHDLLANVNNRVEPFQDDWQKTTSDLRKALNEAEMTIASLQGMTTETSEFRYRLDGFLKEVTYTAQSLRTLTEYLERNPDALLRGKTTNMQSGGK